MKSKPSAGFAKLFEKARKHSAERLKKAGKHKCIPTLTGTISRVTGRNNKILKHPFLLIKFYECDICGRPMDPPALKEDK